MVGPSKVVLLSPCWAVIDHNTYAAFTDVICPCLLSMLWFSTTRLLVRSRSEPPECTQLELIGYTAQNACSIGHKCNRTGSSYRQITFELLNRKSSGHVVYISSCPRDAQIIQRLSHFRVPKSQGLSSCKMDVTCTGRCRHSCEVAPVLSSGRRLLECSLGRTSVEASGGGETRCGENGGANSI